MPVKKIESNHHLVSFCTFTCYNWYCLFEITKFYDGVYNWFNILLNKGNKILGYVVMPNHVHFIIYFTMPDTTLNKVVGTGKRFMAYDISERLKQQEQHLLLDTLAAAVNNHDKKNNKLHEVFKPSFDHKPCYSYEFIEQKIEYIHHNPVTKHWRLVDDWRLYPHSSASFYETGVQRNTIVTHYRDIPL